jgi:drug/metabolite transporter (DMT)-like permease
LPAAAVYYALISSLFFSLGVVTLRPLFRDKTSPETATFYTLLVGIAATGSWLAGATLVSARESLTIVAILYFVLSGILGASVARFASYHAFKILGATRGNFLVNSSPLFVLPMSAIFLGEVITVSKIGGAILVCTAILILSMEGISESNEALFSRFTRRGAAFGLLAAVLYTFARLARKAGMDLANAPVSGSFVSSVTALLVVSGAAALTNQFNGTIKVERSAAKVLFAAGLLQALGQVLEFAGYGTGDASLVVPLRGTTPLITAGLSYLFIRQYERMTRYLVVAIFVGVLGIVVLSLGS